MKIAVIDIAIICEYIPIGFLFSIIDLQEPENPKLKPSKDKPRNKPINNISEYLDPTKIAQKIIISAKKNTNKGLTKKIFKFVRSLLFFTDIN